MIRVWNLNAYDNALAPVACKARREDPSDAVANLVTPCDTELHLGVGWVDQPTGILPPKANRMWVLVAATCPSRL